MPKEESNYEYKDICRDLYETLGYIYENYTGEERYRRALKKISDDLNYLYKYYSAEIINATIGCYVAVLRMKLKEFFEKEEIDRYYESSGDKNEV